MEDTNSITKMLNLGEEINTITITREKVLGKLMGLKANDEYERK